MSSPNPLHTPGAPPKNYRISPNPTYTSFNRTKNIVNVRTDVEEYLDPEPVLISSDEEQNGDSVLAPLPSPPPKFSPVQKKPNFRPVQKELAPSQQSQDVHHPWLDPAPFDESPYKEVSRHGENYYKKPCIDLGSFSTETTANILTPDSPQASFTFSVDNGSTSRISSLTNNSIHQNINFRAVAKKASTLQQSSLPPRQPSKDDDSNENPWLFEQVTDTLGPRAQSADMESLGEKSRQSHRSRRRRHHRHKKAADRSVGSRSKGSRSSARSQRSQLSQMSSASRSVATDLLRLEAQLAMLGKNTVVDQFAPKDKSISSRGSRSSKRKKKPRTVMRISVPPGKLGVILANRVDQAGTLVSDVREHSPIFGKIMVGDKIVKIDGEDVSRLTVSEITSIMAQKAQYARILTVIGGRKRMSTDLEETASLTSSALSSGDGISLN